MSGVRDLRNLLAPWVRVDMADTAALTGITLDSREAQPGGLFLALAGSRGHGLDYLEEALAAGVAAIAWEPGAGHDPQGIACRCRAAGASAVAIETLGQQASAIAARYYGEPGAGLHITGVTGTDGKTSVTHYAGQLMTYFGESAAVMGTLGWDDTTAATLTTADPVTLQARLADLRDRGTTAVAMEVSSHALAQHRVDAVPFDTAVLTYVGRDHLDYHGSVEAYRAAKRRLFLHPGLSRCVLNRDDALGAELLASGDREARALSYGEHPQADVHLQRVVTHPDGLEIDVAMPDLQRRIGLPLFGRFNAMNALAALCVVLDRYPPDEALSALASLRAVPGRMEHFGNGSGDGPLAVVDYAHTPGALEAALTALRAHLRGRLICVFGCGGERDAGKRPLMGAAAARLADAVIVTDDNPRNEDPGRIRAAILQGCSGVECQEIGDRQEAIRVAITSAGPGDVVLVAGKGHEAEQIIGGRRYAFSDREVVARLITGVAA